MGKRYQKDDQTDLGDRYLQEQRKRLSAPDYGSADLDGRFARYLADPNARGIIREPLTDDVDATVVGAGWSGLIAGAALRSAGVDRIRIIDRAGGVGGVWYWNRYPGAGCDTESSIYLPLLEELGYSPTRRYSLAPEIRAYAERLAIHFDLLELAMFETAARELTWDERRVRWLIRTDRDDEFTSKYVVLCDGSFSKLRIPDIPGLDQFKGHFFHTSRWDYAYTGGSETAPLTGFEDKHVGLVGTSSTAVQCMPPIAESAERLSVFQRTPAIVLPRQNRDMEPRWTAGLAPGWQMERMRSFTALTSGGEAIDLVRDGWTELYVPIMQAMRSGTRSYKAVDDELMERIRARISCLVRDSATAQALQPWYHILCKRQCFHDGYLESFNRDNVELVDTDGQGITAITPRGIIAGDREYSLDCIVFATGFEYNIDPLAQMEIEIRGRGGRRLADHWREGRRTLHGVATSGYPNLLIMPGSNSQTALSLNFMHTIIENGKHLGAIVESTNSRGHTVFEVTKEAEDAWVEAIVEQAYADADFLETCTPGIKNNRGAPRERNPLNGNVRGNALEHFDMLDGWRRDGSMAGLHTY